MSIKFFAVYLFSFISFNTEVLETAQDFNQYVRNRQIQARIRVMTFNSWFSGINVFRGLEKMAQHINTIKPDIIALQVKIKQSYFKKPNQGV